MSSLEVVAAWDRTPIRTLTMHDEAHCLAAIARAHERYRDRDRWLSAHERAGILERFAALVTERAEELARVAAREGGKPLLDSRVELARAAQSAKVAVHEMWQQHGTEVPMGMTPSSEGRVAFTYREPRGVVLAISAFNHPFNLIVHQVIPAVATGCPVLVKPSLVTPLSCLAVVSLLRESGLPEDLCEVLLCSNEVAERLVADPRVAFLSFIGSDRVGWHLRSRLAPGASCALEHGGAAPVIVEADADLERAVPLLAKGGFYHAGQVCVSAQRLFVRRSIATRFVDALATAAEALVVGDPLDERTEVGPLIAPREVDRVHAWVEEAVAAGGRLRTGGRRLGVTSYAPTIVVDPPDSVRLSREEVFGPVVAVYPYEDLREAIRRANALELSFQAAVFTRDVDVALDTARRLDGMTVLVNDHPAFRADWMPFGGHKRSGLGVGGIGPTMRDMQLERMIVLRQRPVPSRGAS
jgi:acyl-CoA reductase-like NAD-dependent aldehyde dehydrogenase